MLLVRSFASSFFGLNCADWATDAFDDGPRVNIAGAAIIRSPSNTAWFLEYGAELEALECREPLVFKFVAETVPLVDHLDHDDGVSDEELLDEAGSLDLRMRHQEHDHDLYLIDEREKVKELSDVM